VKIMECRSCREALTAYLDGELASRELQEVDTHLAGCTNCRDELESLKFAYDLTMQLPELDVSADLWDRIYTGLLTSVTTSPDSNNFSRRAWPRKWIPIGATLAGLLAVVLMLAPGTNSDPVAEQKFAEFLRQREQISIHNRQLLNNLDNHHLPAINPFVEAI